MLKSYFCFCTIICVNFSYLHPDNQEVAREYADIIRRLPVPESRKIRERVVHMMTRRKYDAEKDKM